VDDARSGAPKEPPTELELAEDRWQLLSSAPQEPGRAAMELPAEEEDAPVQVAAAWEFIQWQQPAEPTPAPPEEPMPLAQAWEFMGDAQASSAPPEPAQYVELPEAELPPPESDYQALAEALPSEPEAPQPEAQTPSPEDGSSTSPYGLRTLSPEEARKELAEEAPPKDDETKEPGER
jgi:hypothetical protein